MKKVLFLVVVMLSFSGCSYLEKVTPESIITAYGKAKVVYSDSKHIVYEIETEINRIDKEGYGENNETK